MGTAATNRTPGAGHTAPRWALFLIVALLAHQCEEWWGGPGFSAWAQTTLGFEIPPSRFLAINTVGFGLFAAAVIGAVREPRLAWLAASVSALFCLNGALHLLATVAFATYSPGTVTGVLLFLPLGGTTLYAMSRVLPWSVFVGAVLAGIGFHALATFTAIS